MDFENLAKFLRNARTYLSLCITSWTLLPALRPQEDTLAVRLSPPVLIHRVATVIYLTIRPYLLANARWGSASFLSFCMPRRCINHSPDISARSSFLASSSMGLFLISCLAVTLDGFTHPSPGSRGIKGGLSYLFSISGKSFRALSCPKSPGSCRARQG